MDMSEQEKDAIDAGIRYGMQVLEQMPKDNNANANITGVLIVFWGALWGPYGTEYARGFIESQLRGMKPDVPHAKFTKPSVQ